MMKRLMPMRGVYEQSVMINYSKRLMNVGYITLGLLLLMNLRLLLATFVQER
jgi:hypothetical protein